MAIKLTKRRVHALLPRADRFDIYDSDLSGFAVRVTPDGVKTFSLVYRAGTGRAAPKRRMTIGRYGPLTVEEARQIARKSLSDVLRGCDPAVERAQDKRAPTLARLGVDYLADVRIRRKTTTAREYTRLWERHVCPALGTHRVVDVRPADIARLHSTMRDTPYSANRVLALLGSFFTYAERQGIRPKRTNPAHEIETFAERSRERFLTQAEVVRLGNALNLAERAGLPPASTRRRKWKTGATAKHRPKSADKPKPANPFAVAAIRFLLLTGWREREALTLRWDDVDFARGIATLSDSKTGKSVRAIGAPALLLMSELPRFDGSPYVFPGRSPGQPLVEINRVWYAVRHAARLEDVRLHDLRHSFASVSASSGGSLLIIGKLLGHRESATTAKYAHLLDDPVKAAADAASGQIAAWLHGAAQASI